MDVKFGAMLGILRREAGLSQRQLASDLKISQALLSGYENSNREPGLPFVCAVCDYFGVTADYMLGRPEAADERPVSSPEISGLLRAAGLSDGDVRDAAKAYLEAASRRVSAHINKPDSPLEAAQALADMSEAELRLLQILSKRDSF